MKQKNTWISISIYIIAFAVLFWGIRLSSALDSFSRLGAPSNSVVAVIFFALIIAGIVYGVRSIKRKETAWLGNLLVLTGTCVGLYFLLMYSGALAL